MGYPMPLPAGLDALWGTGPTEAEARALLDLLFYDPPGDEAVAARLEAMRAQPHYRELFPAPRQRWVDALSLSEAELASIAAPVLLIHGIDDPIVPPEHSVIPLLRTLPERPRPPLRPLRARVTARVHRRVQPSCRDFPGDPR